MSLIYPETVKRVHFYPEDNRHLAELRELLQRQSARRLSDNDVIRKALVLALGLMTGTENREK